MSKQFLFNPNNPKKSFDVYIDKNPKDTIPIKYKTLEDVKKTIKKLERLYKSGKYPHKRISQVAMIMMVRLRVINPKDERTKVATRYFGFLKERTKKKEVDRKKMIFK
jgi:molybdopterin converting factor small subunit